MWLYKLKKFIYERLIGLKNIIKEMARMKNLVILVILILTAISCSYVESGERQLRGKSSSLWIYKLIVLNYVV